jgi:hypothetical protein
LPGIDFVTGLVGDLAPRQAQTECPPAG